MNDLYQTYEHNKSMIVSNKDDQKSLLLPIAHSTQFAQIEITIDENGMLIGADEVLKENAFTIIPVTEDSGSRGNGNNPHPLEDKLEYIAGDFEKYTGKRNEEKYNKYLENLKKWKDSEYSSWQIEAIYKYLEKKTLMKDLIQRKVLEYKDGNLSDKKIHGNKQQEAFVRFKVLALTKDNENEVEEVFRSETIFEQYIQYYLSQLKNIDLCYITGEEIPCGTKHPAKIQSVADKSKLISANDTSGFTYRGRFYESSQVVSIGYEISQKAHNALRWIISKQGFRLDTLTVAVWEISGKKILPIQYSTMDTFDDYVDPLFDDEDDTDEIVSDINESYARNVEKASKGYRTNLGTKANIVIMGLEAATTGRLSIRFYEKMTGYEYIDSLIYWHKTCAWRLEYVSRNNREFIGAPALENIAMAAFGERNKKIIKATVERLIPCVTEKKCIPTDIVRAATMRVSNPYSFEGEKEYKRDLSVTCAIIRKEHTEKIKKNSNFNNKEEYSMSLDRTNQDRSYLFGRLLGAAQELERYALSAVNGEKRMTAAERYMQRFQRRPLDTWNHISSAISPYKAKLQSMVILEGNDENKVKVGRIAQNRLNSLQEIYDLFEPGDFEKKEPLTGTYLLGYNCQLNSYRKGKKEEN